MKKLLIFAITLTTAVNSQMLVAAPASNVHDFSEYAKRGTSVEASLEALLKEHKNVVLDFWAPWCGPCKELGTVLPALASEHSNVLFVKVNIDQYKSIQNKYGVRSVPTLVYIQNGKKVKQECGYRGKGAIKKNICSLF